MTRLSAALFLYPLLAQGADPVREPWNTSRLKGSPDPPAPYTVERVSPSLGFSQGLELLGGLGLGRIFVTERFGKIWSFREDGTSAKPDVFADLKALHPETHTLYNVAFHPRFRENNEVFIFYTASEKSEDGSRISRFKLASVDPPAINPASEEILLTFHAGGHNGGHMLFGPDGFLYISAGDMREPFPPDPMKTGQDLTDLASSIIRIDVDHPSDGKPYAIPPGNPFVGKPNIRPEIYAYGLRNPWKMAFRPKGGDLLVGDVGWEMWEMLDRVTPGANFGWPIVEGPQPVRSTDAPGPTPILPPLLAYPHSEGASITAGYFWESKARLPELHGLYLFGDFVSGKIWTLNLDTRESREIADTTLQLVSFGRSDSGEVYLLDFGDNTGLYRLVLTESQGPSKDFPRHLSETGLFADTADARPHSGVYPYEPVVPMWHDGATAKRWIAVPNQTTITDFKRPPEGTVFAKTLERDGRRMETQVLVFEGRDCAAYTYRWNAEQTDAELVGKEGETRDGWHFSSRADCLRCHNPFGGPTLGFTPNQLDGPQLDLMKSLALIAKNVDPPKEKLVSLAAEDAPLAARARSWLHANCAHCHSNGGGGSVTLQLNIGIADSEMNALDALPLRGDFGLAAARIIAPGAPFNSALIYRAATSGQGHMPVIGARHPDPTGLRALHDWITSLPGEKGTATTPTTDALAELYPFLSTGTAPSIEILDTLRAQNNPATEGLIARFSENSRLDHYFALKGDVEKGRAVFASLCATCHRVGSTGIEVGPDLTFSASRLSPREILENILQPGAKIDPLYAARTLTFKDGTTLTGISTESGTRLKVPGLPEPLAVDRTKVSTDTALATSLMPPGLLESLPESEAADLLAYLATLR